MNGWPLMSIIAPRTGLGTEVEVDRLVGFRRELRECLSVRGDALFELADAVLCTPGPVWSLPHLSLEDVFRRGHGSVYAALSAGRIDTGRLGDLLVRAAMGGPRDAPGGGGAGAGRRWFAVDTSSWLRPAAITSPERVYCHSPVRYYNGKPYVPGWPFQWVCALDDRRDAWVVPVDVERVPVDQVPSQIAAAQVRAVAARIAHRDGPDGPVPLFVFDAGYDPAALTMALAAERVQVLVRLRTNRVFHPDPAPRPAGTPGRPPVHGPRFVLADPGTWPPADQQAVFDTRRYGVVRVAAWHRMHPRLPASRLPGHQTRGPLPIVRGTLIHVQVQVLPKAAARAGHTTDLWLWWHGPTTPDLDECWQAYLHRFDIEHFFRFAKTTLGWTTPALRTPEQADRWSRLIATAAAQLHLARPLVAARRLPWERPLPADRHTPTRTRRGFRELRHILGTPAGPPKPTGCGPGRPKDSLSGHAPRHRIIKKPGKTGIGWALHPPPS